MQHSLDDYIASHISPEPQQLYEIYRHTNLYHVYGRMCSGHVQGRVLKMLTTMCSPQRILEIGTFTGYSALCIAEGMPQGAQLHTLELDDEWEDELLSQFSRHPRGADIHLHIGDAMKIIPTLRETWDMVYIDANKRHYIEYFELVLPMIRPGGFIIADNTLWDGKILEIPLPSDPQTRGIAAFNDHVANDPRVETVILPLRDGLTLLRKL